MDLPVDYTKLTPSERKFAREQYVEIQNGKCFYCKEDLLKEPPEQIKNKKINWDFFPENFLRYPIHLQHNHKTGMTEGAVHNLCNAVMWQHENQ